ncbi:serine hydrolase domain-containing protein [Nesterenkonia muleiensis]|uniref:serine hydrolase domain-containing protein n=1 Tax=Nesterenkonia muleiensis TaxID=2282648 RepID=UPI000E73AAD2|nr:serine hydrolase domain-containing protein [Nesterenkonia muleiensis]
MTIDKLTVLRSAAPYLASWASHQAEHRGATGLQLAVAYHEEVVVNLAWGKANGETGQDLTEDHLFRIASHSKTMTAVLTMQLIEKGTLRLDDQSGEIVPELLDSPIASLTVRELLGHQGGVIRDSSDGDFWQRSRPFPDREQLMHILRAEGAVFEANEHFKYTNIGYSLLGLILERVTGQTYAELSKELIVRPLALTRTGPEYVAERAEEYAAGHTGRTAYGDVRRTIGHVDTRAMAAATGWYSTAVEMTTYGAAHVFGNETLLTDSSKRLMQRKESAVTFPGGETRHYGLGLDLGKIGDRELVGHSGGYPGHITRTWIDPKEGLVVSGLTNAIDGPADAIVAGVIQLINLAFHAAEAEPEPIPDALKVTGRFGALWGVTDIADLGGVLHVIPASSPDPLSVHQKLEVKDGALIYERKPGYGTTGEAVEATYGDDGEIFAVRLGAISAWPIKRFRAAMATRKPGEALERMAL